LAAVAWWAFGQANVQRAEAVTNLKEARIGEGRFYLELARRKDEPLPDAQILAAQAMAFQGYGRPAEVELAKLVTGQKDFGFWKNQPPLLDPVRSKREWNEAKAAIEGPPGEFRPILLLVESYPVTSFGLDRQRGLESGRHSPG